MAKTYPSADSAVRVTRNWYFGFTTWNLGIVFKRKQNGYVKSGRCARAGDTLTAKDGSIYVQVLDRPSESILRVRISIPAESGKYAWQTKKTVRMSARNFLRFVKYGPNYKRIVRERKP